MDYLRKLGRFWFPDWQSAVWLLFALLPVYFLQTFIHEFSHAVTAAAAGGGFPKIAPYPHVNSGLGFVNGITFTGGRGFPATPQFVSFGFIVVWSLVGWLAPIRDRRIQLVFRVLLLAACVDFIYNTAAGLGGGSSSQSDWNRFRAASSLSGGELAAITWCLWLVVLAHFAWVYFSAWVRSEGDDQSFWAYRWPAVAFGALSLISLIVAAAVSDPSIDKSQGVFIAYVVAQVVSLVWLVVYFILTFVVDD